MKRSSPIFLELLQFRTTISLLLNYRDLIRILTWRDFLARFRGSIFGLLWAVAQPLLMMGVYTLVFSYILKVRFTSNDSPTEFAVYLLCGLVPWNSFNEGINASCSLMRANPNLVKKVVFPLEVLPVNLTLVTMIQQSIGLILLFVLTFFVVGTLHWQIIFIPIFLLLQFMLQTGLTWILSSISVYLPDIRQVISLITLSLMFITPIMYPETLVPDRFRLIVMLNPLAQLIGMYRRVLMEGKSPTFEQLLMVSISSLFFWMVGFVWFNRTKYAFPDFL